MTCLLSSQLVFSPGWESLRPSAGFTALQPAAGWQVAAPTAAHAAPRPVSQMLHGQIKVWLTGYPCRGKGCPGLSLNPSRCHPTATVNKTSILASPKPRRVVVPTAAAWYQGHGHNCCNHRPATLATWITSERPLKSF